MSLLIRFALSRCLKNRIYLKGIAEHDNERRQGDLPEAVDIGIPAHQDIAYDDDGKAYPHQDEVLPAKGHLDTATLAPGSVTLVSGLFIS